MIKTHRGNTETPIKDKENQKETNQGQFGKKEQTKTKMKGRQKKRHDDTKKTTTDNDQQCIQRYLIVEKNTRYNDNRNGKG